MAMTRVPVKKQGIKSLAAHIAIALTSGLLLFSAFPAPGISWLAYIALVPLLVIALRSVSVWRLMWTTYLVSVVWWLVMVKWITPVTWPGYVCLSLFLGVYWPAGLATIRVVDRRLKLPLALTVPIVWVGLEYIRTIVPSEGFGWFALGHSQVPSRVDDGVPWIAQIADLFGHHGVSFVVAMTNGLILDLLANPIFSRTVRGRRKMKKSVAFAIGMWLFVFFGSIGYGLWRINQEYPTRPGPVVGVIQTNISQDNKDSGTVEQQEANWQKVIDLTRLAAGGEVKPDVVVWPETMVPAALNAEALEYYRTATTGERGKEIYDRLISELAGELDVYLIVGAPANYDWQEVLMYTGTDKEQTWILPGRRYNSTYLYQPGREATAIEDDTKSALSIPSGQVEGRYDKVHRVPFGEYLPWVESWPWLKKNFMRYLSPYGDYDYTLQKGRQRTVFDMPYVLEDGKPGKVRMVTPICFEDSVSRVTRRLVYDGAGKRADLIVNVTNDGWFAESWQREQHLQIAVYRCIENRVPMARSVNTGVSGFIDSLGRIGPVVMNGGRVVDVEGVAVSRVLLDNRETFFGRHGHKPVAILTIVGGVLLVVSMIGRKKK